MKFNNKDELKNEIENQYHELSKNISFENWYVTIDVTNWDVSNVKDMSGMFCGCSDLKELDLSNCNFHLNTKVRGIFWGCDKNVHNYKIGKKLKILSHFSNIYREPLDFNLIRIQHRRLCGRKSMITRLMPDELTLKQLNSLHSKEKGVK